MNDREAAADFRQRTWELCLDLYRGDEAEADREYRRVLEMTWGELKKWSKEARALIEGRVALAERIAQLEPGAMLTVTAGQLRWVFPGLATDEVEPWRLVDIHRSAGSYAIIGVRGAER